MRTTTAAATPFRFFDLTVTKVRNLTPSLRRVTLTGPDADRFGDPGWDQRIKLILPLADSGLTLLPRGADWYEVWRNLPDTDRNPIRTYTTRYVRPGEIDVDVVRHLPATGPAARWIEVAAPGHTLVVLGPDALWNGEHGGVDFLPPARTDQHLLVGDETAAPAIAVVLENLPPTARGIAVLELPEDDDAAYLPAHPGIEVRTFARGAEGERNSWLVGEGAAAARELTPPGTGHEVEEVDVDKELLWEVPRAARGGAALSATSLYAWIAGEAGGVKALRRILVSEMGVDRRSVAFMGYWRMGRAEN